jgi:lysyl-tRNA synthetase class 1
LDPSFREHLWEPLSRIPSPSGKFKSFAEEYIATHKKAHQTLGVQPEYYQTSELYKSGQFNEAIRKVLDKASLIRKIYEQVSASKREPDWLPVQPICPNCGKLGSTYAFLWDGHEISFKCRKDLVPWAIGCGYEGKVSPFDGRAKMNWRVEWAAKWDLWGVSIEWAGKDHASKGGSLDTGRAILKEVFGKEGITLAGHEWFTVNGKSMSSSKGIAVSPEQALEVFAPEILRFLLVRNRPQQAIEINLTRIVPRTYDEYDRCQLAYLEKTDQNLADYFYYSQVNPRKIDGLVKARFSAVVNLVQLPSMKKELEDSATSSRVPYAKNWLKAYAPDEVRFSVQESLPPAAKELSEGQRQFLKQSLKLLGERDGEALQQSLYELSGRLELHPAQAFQAVYLSLIGKPSGPRAGMLISSQPEAFVRRRFSEASK